MTAYRFGGGLFLQGTAMIFNRCTIPLATTIILYYNPDDKRCLFFRRIDKRGEIPPQSRCRDGERAQTEATGKPGRLRLLKNLSRKTCLKSAKSKISSSEE